MRSCDAANGRSPGAAARARGQGANRRRYWRWRSSSRRVGRPEVNREIRELIRQMSVANPLWGAPRIHGEMLKLGCGGPCHRVLNPDGQHLLLRLTRAIGDPRRPTQLVHFITPYSPQPQILHEVEFCAGTAGDSP